MKNDFEKVSDDFIGWRQSALVKMGVVQLEYFLTGVAKLEIHSGELCEWNVDEAVAFVHGGVAV